MTGHVVVLTTAPDVGTAERLASDLVEARLAACVNVVGGVTSIYRWKGALTRDGEVFLVIKTRAERVDALRDRLVESHPYEVPEVLVLPVSSGHAPYLAWIDESVEYTANPKPPGRDRDRPPGPRRPRTRR